MQNSTPTPNLRLFPKHHNDFELVAESDDSFTLQNRHGQPVSRLNSASALVWSLCDGFRRIEDIVQIARGLADEAAYDAISENVIGVLARLARAGVITTTTTCGASNDFSHQNLEAEPGNAEQLDIHRYNISHDPIAGRFSARGQRLYDFCLGDWAQKDIPPCTEDIAYSEKRMHYDVLLLGTDEGVLTLKSRHPKSTENQPLTDQKRIVEALIRQGAEIPSGLKCWLIRGDAAGSDTDPLQGPHIGICRKPEAKHIILLPGCDRERLLGPALADQMDAMKQHWCAWDEKLDKAWWGGDATGLMGVGQYDPLTRHELLRYFSDHPSQDVCLHPVSYPQWQDDSLMPAQGQFRKQDAFKYKCLVLLKGNDVASALSWYFCGNSVVLMRPPVFDHIITFEMQPWVHYVPLEAEPSDILVKLKWVLDHPNEAQTMVARAHDHLRWLSGPEYLWACNKVLRRLADSSQVTGQQTPSTESRNPCHAPSKKPVVFFGPFTGPAFRLGGTVVIEELRRRGIEAQSGSELSIDSINDSTVVIVHRVVLNNGETEIHMGDELRELLEALKSRNNIVIYDVRDLFYFTDEDNPARDLVDQVIFPTNAFERRFFERGGATARIDVIHGFCDPRILNHRSPAGTQDMLRPVYYGRSQVGPRSDYGGFQVLEPRTMTNLEAHLDELKTYNLHIDVNEDWTTSEYKPLTKLFTAAGCNANIITKRTSRTLEILPEDYPFFIDHPDELPEMLKFAEKVYGGPVWRKGLEQMVHIKNFYTIDRYMNRFIPLLNSL